MLKKGQQIGTEGVTIKVKNFNWDATLKWLGSSPLRFKGLVAVSYKGMNWLWWSINCVKLRMEDRHGLILGFHPRQKKNQQRKKWSLYEGTRKWGYLKMHMRPLN